MSTRFELHARTVTLLTFLSRMTGLARDAALARVFGLSPVMDAFWLAFLVPNLFRRLFGEGALSASFLPAYSQLQQSNPAVAKQLATLTISLLVTFLGFVTLLGEIVLFFISMRADHEHLAVRLMMITLPYMPMICTVAMLGAMLQVHGRFGPTAAAPLVLNLCLILAAWGCAGFFPHEDAAGQTAHIHLVAVSVILAGVLQVTWSLWALRSTSWWVRPLRETRDAIVPMRRMLQQAWPMFIGLGVLQVNTFIDGLIASYGTTFGPTIFGYDFPLLPGALTALNNAQRLYEFPLGVFGIAIATAIFPALSRVAGDSEQFSDILRRGLRLVVYIGLPASIGLILVREPLTAAILQGRNFTEEDTRRVAFVLLGYAPVIWAYSMIHVLTRAFYARSDSFTPVRVAVSMVALNIVLNVTLIWTPLREAGLAWSTAICATVQVVILLSLARRHVDRLLDSNVIASWTRTLAVSLQMGIVVWTVAQLLPDRPLTWSWAIIQLALLVPAGAVVVLLGSLAMRMPELNWMLGRSGEAKSQI